MSRSARETTAAAGQVSRKLRKLGHAVLYRQDRKREGVFVTNGPFGMVTIHFDLDTEQERLEHVASILPDAMDMGVPIKLRVSDEHAFISLDFGA